MRNVRKAIKEYEELAKNGRKYQMNFSELMEIWNISEEENPGSVSDKIVNGVYFGFTIGYRAAKRDMMEKRRETAH